MPTLSILCVAYRPGQYESILAPTLSAQTFRDYQLLLIDNASGRYPSMRAAVESVRPLVEGELVMLIHPDIRLPAEDTLGRIVSECRASFPAYSILGGAGALSDRDGFRVIASLTQENGFRPGRRPEAVTPCLTLDECIAVMPRSVFDAYPLADLGNSFHLYLVELCCRLHQAGQKAGVFTPEVVHASLGHKDSGYYRTLSRVAGLYRGALDTIPTTCGAFPTDAAALFRIRARARLAGLSSHGLLGALNAAYAASARGIKGFLLRRVPGSKKLFCFTERLFHARREALRNAGLSAEAPQGAKNDPGENPPESE